MRHKGCFMPAAHDRRRQPPKTPRPRPALSRRQAMLGAAALPLGAPARTRPAGRIVVAGGGLAEIIVALGARHRLAGCDSTSLFPPALRALPQVGYLRNLSAEGVLSLRPDMLLLAHEAGPPPVVAQLRATGVPVLQIGRVQDPAALVRGIGQVADAIGETARGAGLAGAVEADFAALESGLAAFHRRPRALFILAAGAGAPMASGTGTAAEAMIRLAHGRSAIEAYEGYRPLTAEAALLAAPDVIVAPSHSVEARGGALAFLGQPQFALLPAARARRLVTMDSLYLLGFGPRAAHAARDLAAALHDTRPGVALPDRAWLHPGR